MGFAASINKGYQQASLAAYGFVSNQKVQKVAKSVALVAIFGLVATASASLSAQALSATLAGAVKTDGTGWLTWCIRIVGGLMVLGGLLSAISGFNGNEEGYAKVVKVGGGVILLLIGGYMVGQAPTLITTLGLNNMFLTT